MQTKTADVVVIGGGIIGASTAFHLARRGIRNIHLVEMNKVGSGTTAYTAAWIMLQESSELKIRMSQLSFAELHEFHNASDIGMHIKGSLSINTSDNLNTELEHARLLRSLGVSIEILDARQIKAVAPIVNVVDVGIGRLCKDDGLIDAAALLQAYLKQARFLSAEVVVEEGVRATAIRLQGGRVVGVDTTSQFISTPIVVNASGIHAAQIGSWIGVQIPIRNALRHIVFTTPISSIPDDMPLLEILNPQVIYIGSTGRHADYTIGSFDTDGFEHKPRLELLMETHFDDLLYRVPEVAQAGIMSCIAGIRSITPDGLPIAGPVDGIPGYFNSCGWAGNGIMYSPIAGQLVAGSITGIDRPPIPIDPFLLRRFNT